MQKSPNSTIAVLFGSLYLALGAFGVSAVMDVGLFSTTGGLLFQVFEVNIATNALHAIIGLGLIIAGASGAQAAKSVTVPVGLLFLVLAGFGAIALGSDANILALNLPDAILYFATGILLLATGVLADRPAQKVAA